MPKQAAEHHKEHAAPHHREAAKHHRGSSKASRGRSVREGRASCPRHRVLPALLPCHHSGDGIGEAKLTRLQAHLFVCQPQEAIGTAMNVEEVRRHFRMISMNLDDEPPPAA